MKGLIGQLVAAAFYSIVPALLLALGFNYFLGHRSDYLGHFAAGYGGTLAGLVIVLAAMPAAWFRRFGVWTIVPACLVAIGIGAIAEATVFRIAKFDEIDFFNQSLGAVLAGLVMLNTIGDSKPRDAVLGITAIVGVVFLFVGYYYALL